jgi:hypothetical protein
VIIGWSLFWVLTSFRGFKKCLKRYKAIVRSFDARCSWMRFDDFKRLKKGFIGHI